MGRAMKFVVYTSSRADAASNVVTQTLWLGANAVASALVLLLDMKR